MCFGAHLVLYMVYWKFPTSGIRATITIRLLGFKALFDMYYIWIILVIWTLILFWEKTILINKIVKPLNSCVMAIKFFSSLELIKGLYIWFTGLYNFLFCLCCICWHIILFGIKVLRIWCWHLVCDTIS